jgi:CubicO group peptidase (beta-lactamase class C family)
MADDETPGFATPLTNFMDRGETGYIYRLGRPRNAVLQVAGRGGPQGGASSTGDDLMAFDVAFRSGKLTSPAMVSLMTSAQGPAVGGRRGVQPETSPGLGFEVTSRNGHTMVGHQGGDLGIGSFVYNFPETGYTMVVMSNRDPRAVRVMLQMLRALITRSTLHGATPPSQDCAPPS